jgi:hypothetical protein
MPNTTLTHLVDQWTVLREHYAFATEALLRLVADHPDLTPDVVQGAIQNILEINGRVLAFNQALSDLRGRVRLDARDADLS